MWVPELCMGLQRYAEVCRLLSASDHPGSSSSSLLLAPDTQTQHQRDSSIPQQVYRPCICQTIYLQLFDGVSSSANHQPHLTRWDQHLLHRGSALPIAMETGTVSTAVHDLDQQPLRLPVKTQTWRSLATGRGEEVMWPEEVKVEVWKLTQCSLESRSENTAAPSDLHCLNTDTYRM